MTAPVWRKRRVPNFWYGTANRTHWRHEKRKTGVSTCPYCCHCASCAPGDAS